MKTHTSIIIRLAICLSIVGCGGAKEESNTTKAIETSEDDFVSIIMTNELVSEPQFDLLSGYDVNIELKSSDKNAFINICSDFHVTNGVATINYDSCKLRTSFDNKDQMFTINLSVQETKLIAQIWPVVENSTPTTVYWQQSTDDEQWEIEI